MYMFQGVADGLRATLNSCRRLARKFRKAACTVIWSGRQDMAKSLGSPGVMRETGNSVMEAGPLCHLVQGKA